MFGAHVLETCRAHVLETRRAHVLETRRAHVLETCRAHVLETFCASSWLITEINYFIWFEKKSEWKRRNIIDKKTKEINK